MERVLSWGGPRGLCRGCRGGGQRWLEGEPPRSDLPGTAMPGRAPPARGLGEGQPPARGGHGDGPVWKFAAVRREHN